MKIDHFPIVKFSFISFIVNTVDGNIFICAHFIQQIIFNRIPVPGTEGVFRLLLKSEFSHLPLRQINKCQASPNVIVVHYMYIFNERLCCFSYYELIK